MSTEKKLNNQNINVFVIKKNQHLNENRNFSADLRKLMMDNNAISTYDALITHCNGALTLERLYKFLDNEIKPNRDEFDIIANAFQISPDYFNGYYKEENDVLDIPKIIDSFIVEE